MRVVFPDPLAPINGVQLPVSTSNEMFSKENDPAWTVSWWMVSMGKVGKLGMRTIMHRSVILPLLCRLVNRRADEYE